MEEFWQEAIDLNEEIIAADGWEDCIVGVGRQFNDYFMIYDAHKIVQRLIEEGMTSDEAWEYYEFNIAGAYVGKFTPIFLEVRP